MALKQKLLRRLQVDPAFGVGLVILGILVMGVSGAATWHYVFNIGTGIALLGAAMFVVSVTAHALVAPPSDGDGSQPPPTSASPTAS